MSANCASIGKKTISIGSTCSQFVARQNARCRNVSTRAWWAGMLGDAVDRLTATFKGQNVLIVGASGFLGSPVARRIAEAGARVFGVCRRPPPNGDVSGISWIAGDVTDPLYVKELFSSTLPTIVIHLASESQGGLGLPLVLSSFRNDVIAAINVLHAAASARVKVERFVMTGSLEEPRGTEPTPHSPYAAAKLASSAYGRMFRQTYGLDVRIVRPMMTYGPGQKPYKIVPSTILSLLRNQRAVIGSGSRLVDWVYLDDVVEGLIAAACKAELSHELDLGTGTLVSVADMTSTIARLLKRPNLLEIHEGARGDEIVRAADVKQAQQVLQFNATTSLLDGLTRTISFYRSQAFNESSRDSRNEAAE